MIVRLTPEAAADLESALDYLHGVSPAGASRLVDRIEDLLAKLGEHPGIGRATSEPGIRQVNTHPLPYVLFYEAIDDSVLIHAIRHGARKREPVRLQNRTDK